MYFVHACGLRVFFLEHGALGSRQFAPKIVAMSVRFIHFLSILPCERACRAAEAARGAKRLV